MKHTKYIGLFRSATGDQYTLETHCFGLIQAFFLLTADAIRSGKHYQLHSITHEDGSVYSVDDILNLGKLMNYMI